MIWKKTHQKKKINHSSPVARDVDVHEGDRNKSEVYEDEKIPWHRDLLLPILAIIVIELKSPATVYEPEVLPDVAVVTMDEWNEPVRREEVKPKPPKPIESFDVPPVINENVPEPIDDLIFDNLGLTADWGNNTL